MVPAGSPTGPIDDALEHDADGSGAACWPRWPLARAVRRHWSPQRTDGRRGHRIGRQDVDQGPDRRGAASRSARGRGAARFVQQRTRPSRAPRCAPTRTPSSWCWSCPPAASATSPTSPQIAPPKIGAVLNVGTAHLGEFGSVEAIAAGQRRTGRGTAGGRGRRRRHPQRRRSAGAAMAARTTARRGHRRHRRRCAISARPT